MSETCILFSINVCLYYKTKVQQSQRKKLIFQYDALTNILSGLGMKEGADVWTIESAWSLYEDIIMFPEDIFYED